MGELEKILNTVSSAVVELPNVKVETIEDEVRAAFEELKKIDKDAEKFEEIKPVVEQELDPSAYTDTGYDLELTYGGETVKGYYETAEAKTEENTASYEHKFLENAQEIAHNAHEANITNRTYAEAAFDVHTKTTITQMKIISTAMWWVMYEGKIQFN